MKVRLIDIDQLLEDTKNLIVDNACVVYYQFEIDQLLIETEDLH